MSELDILVVDDEPDVRELVVELLERAGYAATAASDGREGLRMLYGTQPDLVVLDVTMPGMDGWQVLERIRDLSDVPVLMLTARGTELEKVRGLQAGADDYVVKPFGRQELLARVSALLRRARPAPEAARAYADDLVTVDFAQRAVTVASRPVTLTPTEFKLLAGFVRHPNQVLSHDQLLELAWGDAARTSPEQVKLYVGYLRRKFAEATDAPSPIETVRGFGYRYRRRASERS
jgi:DNA-binding response OmpR family regulator